MIFMSYLNSCNNKNGNMINREKNMNMIKVRMNARLCLIWVKLWILHSISKNLISRKKSIHFNQAKVSQILKQLKALYWGWERLENTLNSLKMLESTEMTDLNLRDHLKVHAEVSHAKMKSNYQVIIISLCFQWLKIEGKQLHFLVPLFNRHKQNRHLIRQVPPILRRALKVKVGLVLDRLRILYKQ